MILAKTGNKFDDNFKIVKKNELHFSNKVENIKEQGKIS